MHVPTIAIDFPPFFRDSRGNRLAKSAMRTVHGSDHVRLYLCGPEEVAQQVLAVLQPLRARQIALDAEQRKHWTHRIHVEGAIPDEALKTIKLLEKVLTLVEKPGVNTAIALDFYKDPDSDPDPMKWKDTSAGTMVSLAKYRGHAEAFDDLVGALARVVTAHKIFAGADFVAIVPGHDTKKTSFGEHLAIAVAKRVNKPVVKPSTARVVRPAAKTRDQIEETISLEGEFTFGPEVAGRVLIIVDDVYMSGGTMTAMATAAKVAGAVAVLGLVAAKTLRK